MSRLGFSQVIGTKILFTANAFVRQDHLIYTPSPDPYADQPGTVSQNRRLTNVGVKADFAYDEGRHHLKVGGSVTATRLHEQFTLGFTDPNVAPDFAAFNLALGGTPLTYDQFGTVKQQALYLQDEMKAGDLTLQAGVRLDHYDWLSSARLLRPRAGVSYAIAGSKSVLRASYGRTLETPCAR